MSRIVARTVLVVIATSCAPVHAGRVIAPPPDTVPETRVPVSRQPPIADTEEDLFPDPADRTAVRMEAARIRLNAFFRSNGRFPDALIEALPPGGPGSWLVDFTHDAWGATLRYRRQGKDYELTSPGADRQFGTSDDIVVTSTRGTKWA